jgi:mRNA-degrading endonuclease YafQ of YafQ-DinJ toxin-antitoxin module
MQIMHLELRFHPNEKSILCNKTFDSIEYPLIYYKHDNTYEYNKKNYYSVTYYMYYKENYAIGLNGIFSRNKFLGFHDKDIEHVRILYNYLTLEPEYVYFSAHAQEGIWKKYKDCEFNDKNLIVYICYGSHACKPHKGIYLRIFGFANDYCSNKGKYVIPKLINDNTLYYLEVKNNPDFSGCIKPFILPLIKPF